MKPFIMILDLKDVIVEQVKKQGVSFILLALIAYHFQTQNNILQDKVDICNEQTRQQYERQIELLGTVIEQNTKALDRSSAALTNNNQNNGRIHN